MLNISKIFSSKYFKIISPIATFIAFFIILLWGNGIVWQTDQAELEKQKFAFEREKEVTNLRNNIDYTVNEIINLNNEIYTKEKSDTLSTEELNYFKSRYDFLVENLNHYQFTLKKITQVEPHKFIIPNPLKKYFNAITIPSPPTGLRIEPVNQNFLLYTIQTNVITLVIFSLLVIFISTVFTKYLIYKRIKPKKNNLKTKGSK